MLLISVKTSNIISRHLKINSPMLTMKAKPKLSILSMTKRPDLSKELKMQLLTWSILSSKCKMLKMLLLTAQDKLLLSLSTAREQSSMQVSQEMPLHSMTLLTTTRTHSLSLSMPKEQPLKTLSYRNRLNSMLQSTENFSRLSTSMTLTTSSS